MSEKPASNEKAASETRQLSTLGIRGTKLYLILLFGGIPVAAFFNAIEFGPLELNELGDFLAGVFGPLAIFWLVLGFFQQSKELQNSVDALNLQAKELSNSVEQQKEMVQATYDTLDHEKTVLHMEREQRKQQVSPKFNVTFWQVGTNGRLIRRYRVSIENVGHNVRDLTCDFSHDTHVKTERRLLFSTGESLVIEFERPIKDPVSSASVQISYTDEDGHSDVDVRDFKAAGFNGDDFQQFVSA